MQWPVALPFSDFWVGSLCRLAAEVVVWLAVAAFVEGFPLGSAGSKGSPEWLEAPWRRLMIDRLQRKGAKERKGAEETDQEDTDQHGGSSKRGQGSASLFDFLEGSIRCGWT